MYSTDPLLPVSKLKELFKAHRNNFSAIEEIKSKLEIVINKEDSEFSDFTNAIDHDYDLPPIIECLIYFVIGQITKKIKEFTKCEICLNSLFYSKEKSILIENYPFARIITLNKEEQFGLEHSNKRLFVHCNRSNCFELVVNDITEDQLEFSCDEHAKDVYAYIISYYLEMRMRQFAKIKKSQTATTNAEKKKAAKLTKT